MMSQEELNAAILAEYANAADSALQRAIVSAEKWAKCHPDSCIAEDFLHRADVLHAELLRRIQIRREQEKSNG